MKRDINYCECCGDNPATQQRPDDPNVYCDACVATMTREDSGVVFYAMQTIIYALDAIRRYVPAADVRRLVDEALGDVERNDSRTDFYDVSAYELDAGFRPLDPRVPA
jgi:hypothetical protein